MKKKLSIIMVIIITLTSISLIGGCSKTKIRVANADLYSDNGYIDYAAEVFLDKENHPHLQESGLFWNKWDEESQSIVQVAADTEQGAALVDANKPTVINVHGVLLDGYLKQERFYLNGKIADPSEFDLETDGVSMIYLWLREGWNVGTFHYNRFASEMNPKNIECKIWSGEDTSETRGMRFRLPDGSYSARDITQYSLAEHFVADYIRAMRLLPDTMGSQEIRLLGHSMGGQLATAGLFLLTEVADYGQLPKTQLPVRFALLDPYFSTTLEGGTAGYMGPKNITIRWSGKRLVDSNTGITMLEALKDINANNIIIEYYTYDQSFLKIGMLPVTEEFKKIAVYAVVLPDWQGEGYTVLADGHNGVREWYLCSLLAPMVRDVTNGVDTSKFAPSAAMSTESLKALKGKQYTQNGGTRTVSADDDTMIILVE